MTPTVRAGDDPGVTELIDQTAEAADAWMRGDIDRYLDLTHHAHGFTLTAPNGGPPVQFADRREVTVEPMMAKDARTLKRSRPAAAAARPGDDRRCRDHSRDRHPGAHC